jgi:hypothetical protein
VLDYSGKSVATLGGVKSEPGLHLIDWNLRTGGGGGFPGGGGGGGRVPAATYRVVLTVDGQEQSQPLVVEDDPNVPKALISAEEKAELEEQQEKAREAMEQEEREEHEEQGEKPIKRIDY